jgi:hypothetical protein
LIKTKCKCIYVDRGKALIRSGKFSVTIGEFKTGLFSKPIPFYIPENFRNITLEQSGLLFSKDVMPLFVIDAKSYMVLNYIQNPEDVKGKPLSYIDKEGKEQIIGINLIAQNDPTLAVKLKVLIKTSFWEMLAKHLKMGLAMTLIYMASGYGLLRLIEYIIRIIVLKQG